MVKKSSIFSKKNKILFCSKKTSNYRELISKLALESPESILCDRKALNAPKFNLTPEARLKAKKCRFWSQNFPTFPFSNFEKGAFKDGD